MTATRGSWTLDQAIVSRWAAAGLDAQFRDYWTDASYTQYPVLHDGDAIPAGAPGPYCVVQKLTPVPIGHDSGKTSSTVNQLQRCLVRFHVHAKTTTSLGLTGKAIAKALAMLVAAAYDWSYGTLSLSPDTHVMTTRMGDYPMHEEQDEWVWVLEYQITIDCVYDQPT